MFIIGQSMQTSPGKSGYDEAHELSGKVMELKLSVANLCKLKKVLGISVGDE